MRDRAGEIDEIRSARPIRVGAVTLLPLERVVLRSARFGPGAWVSAAVEPWAMIVQDGAGVRVVGVGASPPSLDELRGRIPGLDALLARPDRL
jgi:hypothetical protein